jgi:hypothetical protein
VGCKHLLAGRTRGSNSCYSRCAICPKGCAVLVRAGLSGDVRTACGSSDAYRVFRSDDMLNWTVGANSACDRRSMARGTFS